MKTHRREFLDQALPNILSNLSVPIAGLIDTAMLGHLPEIDSLAGVSLAGIVFSYAYWGFGFLRMGTTGLTAKARGSEDLEAMADTFYRGMVLALGLACLMLLGRGWIGDLGFYLLDGQPEVKVAGRSYFDVRILGAPAVLGLYVINGWLIGTGRPKLSLILSVVLSLTNIGLDALFIYHFQWGAYGAGLATAFTAAVTFLLGVVLITKNWGQCPSFRFSRVFQAGPFRKMLVFKKDILLRTLCLIAAMTTFTNFSASFGKLALTANTILLNLLNMASYFIDGYAYALEAIAGRCAGSGDKPGVLRTLKMANLFALTTAAAIIVFYLAAGPTVLGWLTSHQDVIEFAHHYLPWMTLALVFATLSYVYDGLFIGLANGKIMRDSMVVATALFLPAAWLAREQESVSGLWLAFVAFMAIRTLVLLWKSRKALQEL